MFSLMTILQSAPEFSAGEESEIKSGLCSCQPPSSPTSSLAALYLINCY